MNKSLLYLSLMSLIFWACNSGNQAQTNAEEDVWISLIGEDISNWDNPQNLQAMTFNGELGMTDPGSETPMWLWSQASFKNFHLKAEFQAPPASQSAIGFRMNQANGYAVSLDNNADRQNPTGSITNVARATWLDSMDVEDWNQLEVKAIGDHLQVWVNGTLVSQVHDRQYSEGTIALQAPIGGTKAVKFRHLQIMELPDTELTEQPLEEMMRASTKAEEVSLFDGDYTENWTESGGEWEVIDGAIHGYSGPEGGYLLSKETYQNFYLKLKFKIKFEDNSGIFIRKDPNREDVSIEDAIECNIYDFNGLSHPFSTGSLVTHSRAFRDLFEYEEWSDLEIFAYESQIVMYINGKKSAEAHVPEALNKAGQIALQAGVKVFSEDKGPSDIYFKDIFVKDFSGGSL